MKKKDLVIALGLTSSMGLVGCGDDSNSGTSDVSPNPGTPDSPLSETYSVTAIDGYLRNATVWLDLDGDYQLDSDEPQAISGEGGIANLNVEGIDNPSKYNVVVQATTETVDEDTITENNPDGEKVASPYMMSAPAGTQAVTPLTTKVNLVLEQKKAEATSSGSTTELTDEEVEVLKEAAIHEVAGDNLDPELLMGDYIKIKETSTDLGSISDAARLAYEAKVLVESQQLPETPEELAQAIDEIQADPTALNLLNQLDAVSEQIQKSIETIAKEAISDEAAQNIDFETLALPDFVSEDNVNGLTDDPDNDGIATAFDAFPNDSSEWLDTDGDGVGNNTDTDNDNDGFTNDNDAFPLSAKEYIDTDNDGIGNNADTDDDGDAVADENDAFPLDATESVDTDRDGEGNNKDTDDDNDGILDDDDPFPLDSDESADYDRDGTGDIADDDDDNDGIIDTEDAFPFDSSETQDSDKDGLGNNQDTDDDNDGFADDNDAFPTNPSEYLDSDGDGTGNNADKDDDNDGVSDLRDYFPFDSAESLDSDGDGVGNNEDTDDDNDGTLDAEDAFPLDATESVDTDRDGTGNNKDTDDDNDGIRDDDDLEPLVSEGLGDFDNDGIIDRDDLDDDNDNVADTEDAFPFNKNESADADKDGIGDNADIDDDNDRVPDDVDALPNNPTESLDTDGDGIGNNLDTDDDGDSVADSEDAFPLNSAESSDFDKDGTGDKADTDDDNDGMLDIEDAFPLDASESVDIDNDGIGNNADKDNDNDGTLDDADAFPFNPNETADSDGDKVGDNEDAFPLDASESKDTDGDGVGNNADEFPQDETESADADQDGTGNNEDTDDDNDGTLDDADAFPFNPNETADTDGDGIGDNADTDADGNGIDDALEATALQFIRDADSLYEIHSNDYHDESGTQHEKLYVSAILVSDNIGVTQPAQEVNPDGSLTDITEENEDLILTSEGWVKVNSYTMDATTDIPVAYPTNVPTSTLGITLELVDLEGQAISETTVPFWSEFKSVPAQFPPGSQAVKFTPVASQDIYSLWTGSEVHVSTDVEPHHAPATTLEQVISTTAADVSNGTTHPNLVYFGWNIGVELVDGGTANYYMQSNSSGSTTGNTVTKVAAGEWSRSTTESGVEILEFTVPDTAITAFGEKWDQDSPAMFLSVYDDGDGSYVRMGQIERQGSSFDEVIYLYSETAKTAILEQVVVKAADRDNDGVIDSEDAFPTDGSETVDTDGDGVGNNADSDDDGDGAEDDVDAFPLDATESLDSDGDGIGNNTDPDDNNNGIADVDETAPTASDAIQFIRDASSLYILDADDEYDDSTNTRQEYLYVEPILISENKGVTQTPQLVNIDGALTAVTEEDGHDAILTSSGWTTSNSYTIDVTTDNAVAYPTNIPASQLNLSLELVDLAGLVISPSTVPFWSAYKSADIQFPPGSQAVKFTPSAAQDIYSLWIDSEVHVSTSVDPYHEAATTLEQLISATETDASSSTTGSANPNLVYFGWDMGVELVEGGKANYYLTGSSTSKVGTGTWTRSIISGEDILQFTVPDAVITAYGEKWDEDSPALFASVYDDGKASYVRMGSIEQQGTSFDEDIYLFNETAKTAILEQVVITYTDSPTDGSGNGDNSGGTGSGGDGSTGDNGSDIVGGITTDATNADVVNFIENTTALYEFDDEDDSGKEILTVDAFIVNGSMAESQGFQVIQSDGTLGSVMGDHEDMVLTSSGWVTPAGYTLDISGSTPVAYPTGYSELVYSLGSPMITNLEGEAVDATTLKFWSAYKSGSTAVFPIDSKALQFTPVAVQDIYSLWTDSDVHVKVVGATSEPYHVIATAFDDLKSSEAATDPTQVKLIYLGWDIGVELVADNTANFYKGDENTYQLFKVGETTWSSSVMGGKTVYQFTVTDEAIAAFGDRWHGDPATVLFAENEGVVIRGTVELANQSNDYLVGLFNETAKTAILEQVVVNEADTDNDGVIDSEDAFPTDASETLDTDNDGVGNNADSDDDGDGVADSNDAFPLDGSESVDTDGDNIGNNADNDDDNDGILDDVDPSPLEPDTASQQNAVVNFFNTNSQFFAVDVEEDDNNSNGAGSDELFIETFATNGGSAVFESLQKINAQKQAIIVTANDDEDLQLTGNGWQSISYSYTIDFSGDSILAYPTNLPSSTYTLDGYVKSLAGLKVADANMGWEYLNDNNATYADGAEAVIFDITPNQDKYMLWDWQPWVFRGDNGQSDGQNATSLDELIVDNAITDNASTGALIGIGMSESSAVEFVSDFTVNFYTMDFYTTHKATKIASATWSLEEINGERIMQFTVPQAAIDAWGDRWQEDTPSMLLSEHNGQVFFGQYEQAGEKIANDEVVFINDLAKASFLSSVNIDVAVCELGDNENSATTFADYESAVASCGGAIAITNDMISEQNFHRVRSDGQTRDYSFKADGTLDVAKNGVYAYSDLWTIEGNYLVRTNDAGTDAMYWALVDKSVDTWSLKFFEQGSDAQSSYVEIWSDTVRLTDSSVCTFTEGSSSFEQFKIDVADYGSCTTNLPMFDEADVMGSTISRVNGAGETRALEFNADHTATYYRNGVNKARSWDIDENGFIEIKSADGSAILDKMALIADGEQLTFAVFSFEDSETWTETYVDNSELVAIVECQTGNTTWDDVNDIPLTYASSSEFEQAIADCNDATDNEAKFSQSFFAQLPITFRAMAGDNETYTFDIDGKGIYESEGETMSMTWSVSDETNLVTVELTDGVNSATDALAIVGTNGAEFSLKGYSQASDWEGIGTDKGGDLWSHVYSVK